MKKLLVLLSAVAFVVAFTVPAMAAEKEKKTVEERLAGLEKPAVQWSFYGSSRMTTFFNDVEPEGGDSDTDLAWDLQGNSRIGANVKAGDIAGRFEYGSGPNLRLLYGTWNFGGGTLEVGQDYTPVFSLISNQVALGGDNDLVGYGGIYAGRKPMIQLSTGGLKVALVTPQTGNVVAAATDADTTMPKLEASYTFKAGPVSLKPMFGYNSYSEENAAASYDIDSHVLGLQITAALGAAYVKGNVSMLSNGGSYGIISTAGSAPVYDAVNDAILDNDSMAYNLIAGFKASDAIGLEAGYGHTESELDNSNVTDEADSYYIQAVIHLAKGIFIVPEVGKADHKDVSETTYYGAKWQINF